MRFDKELAEGVIISRPNRFIMMVDIGGKVEKCHCPSTGRIGDIEFDHVPGLLSEHDYNGRKTRYTVEAISVDDKKSWIGINQNRANDYVAFFLEKGMLPKLVKKGKIEREKKIGDSRIDFVVGNTYIEVKTPLISLPSGSAPIKRRRHGSFSSFDRLIKHFNALSSRDNGIILLCYMYDAEPFKAPPPDRSNRRIMQAARSASRRGVERWQINLRIDKKGVRLIRYFKLKPS